MISSFLLSSAQWSKGNKNIICSRNKGKVDVLMFNESVRRVFIHKDHVHVHRGLYNAWMDNIHTVVHTAAFYLAHKLYKNSHSLFPISSSAQTQSFADTATHLSVPQWPSRCLSNLCMGSFQLHWSEHIIPFPSFPLLNTQKHASIMYADTLQTWFPLLTHQERQHSPQ